MSEIFLSYKSEDKAKAQIIAGALRQKGYSVWWDRAIPPGRTFDEVIEENLDASKCVVVLWSKESVKSQWVRTEASEGNRRRILIPILIEDVQPPLAFRMIEAAKLIDWDGSQSNDEFGLLLESIAGILERPKEAEDETHRFDEVISVEKEKKEIRKNKDFNEQEDEIARAKIKEEKQTHSQTENEDKIFSNSFDMKFAFIPAGDFIMGSEAYKWEKPSHKVMINKPFYLGIYPVTQREWKEVMVNLPSIFVSEKNSDNFPVTALWNETQDFIKMLNEKEGTNRYRLPSEAEWEYAVRAGTTTRYFFGDDESKLGAYAWYKENSQNTQEVGKKKPNPWGLYDMYGNVTEWVQDEWHASYKDAPIDGSAWENGTGSSRVVRGGNWNREAWDCRSASRDNVGIVRSTFYDKGFRILMEM